MKLIPAERSQEWNCKHNRRIVFCDCLLEVLPVAFEVTPDEAVPDEEMGKFCKLFGEWAKNTAFLGQVEMKNWLPMYTAICTGVDSMFRAISEGLSLRDEVLANAVAVVNAVDLKNVAALSDELWLSLPSSCDELLEFGKRLVAVRVPSKALRKGQPAAIVLVSASLCYAVAGLRRFATLVSKIVGCCDMSQDFSNHFAALQAVEAGIMKLEDMLNIIEVAEAADIKEKVQNLLNTIIEEKGENIKKLLDFVLRPLVAKSNFVKSKFDAAGLHAKVEKVVVTTTAEGTERGEQLLKLCRGGCVKSLLQAVMFDDAYRAAALSISGWNGGVEDTFKDRDEWKALDDTMSKARATLAFLNIMQEMYKKHSPDRSKAVKDALAKLPRRHGVNSDVLAAANEMVS